MSVTVSYVSYVSCVSYVSYVSYVSCVSYVSYVSFSAMSAMSKSFGIKVIQCVSTFWTQVKIIEWKMTQKTISVARLASFERRWWQNFMHQCVQLLRIFLCKSAVTIFGNNFAAFYSNIWSRWKLSTPSESYNIQFSECLSSFSVSWSILMWPCLVHQPCHNSCWPCISERISFYSHHT